MAPFSIRDLLWLTVVIFLSGWLWLDNFFWRGNTVEHARNAQATAEMLAAELNAIGYHISVSRNGEAGGSGPFKSLVTASELRYAAERLEAAEQRERTSSR